MIVQSIWTRQLLKTRWQSHKNTHRILPGTHCTWGLSQLLPQNNPGMEQTNKPCRISAHYGWLQCLPVHQAQNKPWPASKFSGIVLSTVLGHCIYLPCSCPAGPITFSDDPSPINGRRRRNTTIQNIDFPSHFSYFKLIYTRDTYQNNPHRVCFHADNSTIFNQIITPSYYAF